MFMKNLLLLLLTLLVCPAFAAQDDVPSYLRPPDFLFDGNLDGQTRFLSDYALKTGYGAYVIGDAWHTWQFGNGVDLALAALGKDVVWRTSFTMEAVADSQTEGFFFRLAQTHYDVSTALELRLDTDFWQAFIFYVGYHHRCRHAADGTLARIVMKSGPEVGYSARMPLHPKLHLTSHSALNAFLFGQNEDLEHQPRLMLTTVWQLEWTPVEEMTLFTASGIGATWITSSDVVHYSLMTDIKENALLLSPMASAGVQLHGSKGDFNVYMTYHGNLDPGFGSKAHRIHVLALRGEFWF